MQAMPRRTGDFGCGLMIHVIHLVGDVTKVQRWYEDVFGAVSFWAVDRPDFDAVEQRHASLMVVSDLALEVVAPAQPVQGESPLARAFERSGEHLYSMGFKFDDLTGLGRHLRQQNVYLAGPGGGAVDVVTDELLYFFPSPRDVGGVLVQCSRVDMPDDLRLLEAWSSLQRGWQSQPLAIEGLAYITVGVEDLDRASEVFTRIWQAEPLADNAWVDPAHGARGERSRFLQLGDLVVRLSAPDGAEGPLADHVGRSRNRLYDITFRSADLEAAAAHLRERGIGTERLSPSLLAAEPVDCFGVRYCFASRP